MSFRISSLALPPSLAARNHPSLLYFSPFLPNLRAAPPLHPEGCKIDTDTFLFSRPQVLLPYPQLGPILQNSDSGRGGPRFVASPDFPFPSSLQACPMRLDPCLCTPPPYFLLVRLPIFINFFGPPSPRLHPSAFLFLWRSKSHRCPFAEVC